MSMVTALEAEARVKSLESARATCLKKTNQTKQNPFLINNIMPAD